MCLCVFGAEFLTLDQIPREGVARLAAILVPEGDDSKGLALLMVGQDEYFMCPLIVGSAIMQGAAGNGECHIWRYGNASDAPSRYVVG